MLILYFINDMMKEYKIGDVAFALSQEALNVRLTSADKNVLFAKQNVDDIFSLINHNFTIVNDFYRSIVKNSGLNIEFEEISQISFSIVLHYLYMYNLWRNTYKKQANRKLSFDTKDLSHPSTHDIIFKYFSTKYPADWAAKSAVLIGMSDRELLDYYEGRKQFYNK